jgi:DNA (cytosine-5)-methyltransferase 1
VIFSPHLLPAELGGAPQIRERVFILAMRSDHPNRGFGSIPLVANEPVGDWSPDDWSIESVLDDDDAIAGLERYALRPDEATWLSAWDAFVKMIPDDSLPGFPIWADHFTPWPEIDSDTPDWKADFIGKNSAFYCQHSRLIDCWLDQRWGPDGKRVRDFPASRRKLEWQARKAHPHRNGRTLWDLVVQLRPSGIRVRPATYVPALVAITQTSIVASRRRRLTPREAARLQGMPADVFRLGQVDDATAYKQAGNAVNVGAVRHVAKALFDHASFDYVDEGEARPRVAAFA